MRVLRRKSPIVFPSVIGGLAIALCASCVKYKFGDRTFGSKDDALKASERGFAAVLATVTPTDTPVGGSVRIIIPTREGVADTGIVKRGNPSEDVLDYVATVESRDLETMAMAVERRGVFNKTKIERYRAIGDKEVLADTDADFVLWFYQPAPAAYQWYLLDTASKARSEVPLDLSKPVGAERVNAWLAALERTARRLERRRSSQGR
jgi:hypothetical protein